jgi:predicted NBD/HSP70 family sugar kinase
LKTPQFLSAKSATQSLSLAIELSDGKLSTALVDERGRVLAVRQTEAPMTNGRVVATTISKSLIEMGTASERGDQPITAIGLSFPGWVDPTDQRVTIPGRTGWLRIGLGELVERELTASGIDLRTPLNQKRHRAEFQSSSHPPMAINSRSAALVAAEAWVGAARGSLNVVHLEINDEIEAGLLLNGRILHGAAGRAGAVGWFALSETYREEFASGGCFKFEAGQAALIRRAIESSSGLTTSLLERLSKDDVAHLSCAMVLRAARAGDAFALRIVEDLRQWIGRGIADLISLLNPEVITIGGELGSALKPYYGDLRRDVRRWAHPASARQCRIVAASAGRAAALIGAARLAQTRKSQNLPDGQKV